MWYLTNLRLGFGVSSMKINNRDRQTVGVIPVYCGESTLAKLREEIEDDFEINHFWFVHSGNKLDTSEEIFINMTSVAHKMVDHSTGKCFFP